MMKITVPVMTACKKLSATLSTIFSANNRTGILPEEWLQYQDMIESTPDVRCTNTLTQTTINNISNDAKQCDASFLFIHIPVTCKNKNPFIKTLLPASANSIAAVYKKSLLLNTKAIRICVIIVLTAVLSFGLHQFS
ncbi:MAG: hypothetical protein ABI863_21370, partial [Ginsengibacter sp.]